MFPPKQLVSMVGLTYYELAKLELNANYTLELLKFFGVLILVRLNLSVDTNATHSPKTKKVECIALAPLFVWILCVSFLNINVFDMYGVQTPVVSAPLTPKAPLNAYIWGRKFETYNSIQYFDIVVVPRKFFSLNLSKHVRNWRDASFFAVKSMVIG